MHPDEAFSTRKRTPKSTGAFLSFGRFYAADTWRGEHISVSMAPFWEIFICTNNPPLYSFAFVSTPGEGTTTIPATTIVENKRVTSFSGRFFYHYHILENEHTCSFSRPVAARHTHHLSHHLPLPSKTSSCARFQGGCYVRRLPSINNTLETEHTRSFSRVVVMLTPPIYHHPRN